MIKMGQCHLKHGLTFARAPCKLYFDGKKASPLLTKIFMQLKGKVTVPREEHHQVVCSHHQWGAKSIKITVLHTLIAPIVFLECRAHSCSCSLFVLPQINPDPSKPNQPS